MRLRLCQRRAAPIAGLVDEAFESLDAPELPPASEPFAILVAGIGGTGVRAGIIKVATGQPAISPYERTILEAAAKAATATGAPITDSDASLAAPVSASCARTWRMPSVSTRNVTSILT